jgi:type VI secretion system secreted protein Hcp
MMPLLIRFRLFFSAFLKIDGIEGESTDEKHTGWIEIIRYGIGIRQEVSTTASSSGGACAERTEFSDFKIRKLLDKSSPKMALLCAAGTHINEVAIELCRAGTAKQPYMVYTMNNCIISRVITTSGSDVGGDFQLKRCISISAASSIAIFYRIANPADLKAI